MKTIKLTSNGFTGEDWIKHFEAKKCRVSDYAKQLLRSSDFQPTKDVEYKVVIFKGEEFADRERITKTICEKVKELGYETPHPEIACLLRDKLTDKDIEAMGLWWIVAMHELIKDSDGFPSLLRVDRGGGGRWLRASWDGPGVRWGRDDGFAFAVPQVLGAKKLKTKALDAVENRVTALEQRWQKVEKALKIAIS